VAGGPWISAGAHDLCQFIAHWSFAVSRSPARVITWNGTERVGRQQRICWPERC
jgi:hypothetical protein